MFLNSILSVFVITFVIYSHDINAQFPDKICATSKNVDECTNLQRGNSEVLCTTVQDSIECAQSIRNGTADFGVFSAESALLLAHLGWDSLLVVKELRHVERSAEPVDYQSVAIVRKHYPGGLENLNGLNFCHPGLFYERSQKWSERFLKHFEREVVVPDCDSGLTSPAEIEAAALEKFFGPSCRPGIWSNNIQEDAILKEKYPKLCSLCDNTNNCTHTTEINNHHQQALNCLVKNKGDVTYVSLREATNYFNANSDIVNEYNFLCPNGSLQEIENNNSPCVWLKQPWKVIIANNNKAISLSTSLNRWMASNADSIWETAVKALILGDNFVSKDLTLQTPRDHIAPIRPIPVETDLCTTASSWCTTSLEEKDKCMVIRSGGITTGVFPIINCMDPSTSVVSCLSQISAINKRADFMGIDSNYGYLARHPYNLSAALYAETDRHLYSSVVLIIRNNSTFTRFENFKNARACFPEFAGIASVAFINIGKNRGVFTRSECDYAQLLGDFFSESCLPGAKDSLHDSSSDNPESLCALCQSDIRLREILPSSDDDAPAADSTDDADQTDESANLNEENSDGESRTVQERSINCAASPANRFFGTRGALTCLKEVGDLAILEVQNLAEHARALNLNPDDFRIMCRNGTLADRTGFNVDEACYLTQIVDGEIVVRRGSSKTTGIINALSSFDKYFLNDPDFKMYNIYAGTKNLLFEDSSVGLVSPNDANLGTSVVNYMQLFDNMDNCVDDGSAASTMSISMLIITLCSMFVLVKHFS